jgi:hypothetical protein
MSAIMMAMVAGMALASDGMERGLTETEQPLAIEGYWEGTEQMFFDHPRAGGLITLRVALEPGLITNVVEANCRWID